MYHCNTAEIADTSQPIKLSKTLPFIWRVFTVIETNEVSKPNMLKHPPASNSHVSHLYKKTWGIYVTEQLKIKDVMCIVYLYFSFVNFNLVFIKNDV